MAVIAQEPHVLQARRGRIALFISSTLTCILSLHILDLGLDNLTFKLTLIPIVVGGFLFSYFVDPVFHRGIKFAVNIIAFLLTIYFLWLILQEPSSMGNWLGMLLGVLMTLLAFVAFKPSSHKLFATIGVVFTIFSASTSYELKIIAFFPFFMFFAASVLYFANLLELQEKAIESKVERDVPVSIHSHKVYWTLFKVVVNIFLLSVLVYVLLPHSSELNRPAFMLPRSGSVDETFEELRMENVKELGGEGAGNINVTGFSEEFDLSGQESIFGARALFESDEPAIAMRSSQNGYLRGVVFDVYLGTSWVRSPWAKSTKISSADAEKSYVISSSFNFPLIDFPSRKVAKRLKEEKGISVVKNNIFSRWDNSDIDYDLHTQEIEFLKDHPAVLFSFYQPIRVEDLSRVRRMDGTIHNPRPALDPFSIISTSYPRHPSGFKYTVTVLAPRIAPQKLKTSPGTYPDEIYKRYTQLPTEQNKDELKRLYPDKEIVEIPQRVITFARTLAQGAETPFEKVEKIYRHLRDEYQYTLEFPPLPKGAEATEFLLFKTHAGFCMQFASAMAVLLRINGIPARVVAGYAPGQFSFLQNKYIYKDKNAHAWVEVYFDGFGWVPFDPSPRSRDILTVTGLRNLIVSTVNFFENLFVIDPRSAQRTLLRFVQGLYAYFSSWIQRNMVTILGFVALVALALSAMFILFRGGKRREELKAENEIIDCYLELEKLLRKSAMPREDYETAMDYYARIKDLFPTVKDQMKHFIELYEQSAFSMRRPSKEEVKWAREFLRRFEDSLKSTSA